MEKARVAWFGASAAVGTASVGVIVFDFNANSAWFGLGEHGCMIAMGLALAGVFSGRRSSIDDAFEAGYQAGHHRGQRVRPKVIQLPSERRQERASRR